MHLRTRNTSPVALELVNELIKTRKWKSLLQLIEKNAVTLDHLNQITEAPHPQGKDYTLTVTAANVWHLIFESSAEVLEKLLEHNLITKEHLALRPTQQSDIFYYDHPSVFEVMVRNHFFGVALLQDYDLITPEFLIQHLDADQQNTYLLKLTESEDITNFMACSDAGMLTTASGLADEEETIKEYDQTSKALYAAAVHEGVELAKTGTLNLQNLPTFFQSKLNQDILERRNASKNSVIQALTQEAIHTYTKYFRYAPQVEIGEIYIKSLTENLTEYLKNQDLSVIENDQFKSSVIAAFKVAAEKQQKLPFDDLHGLMDEVIKTMVTYSSVTSLRGA